MGGNISDERRRGQGGFTLIELMVVVLIIGILLAIAVPTFLGARSRGQDAIAKTSVRNALTAANVIYTDSESYLDADAKGVSVAEGSLEFVDHDQESNGPKSVSVYADEDVWGAAARSESGTCFVIATTSEGKVTYGQTSKSCTGDAAKDEATAGSW